MLIFCTPYVSIMPLSCYRPGQPTIRRSSSNYPPGGLNSHHIYRSIIFLVCFYYVSIMPLSCYRLGQPTIRRSSSNYPPGGLHSHHIYRRLQNRHGCYQCKLFYVPFYILTLSSMGGFWTDISKCSEGEGDQFFDFFFSLGHPQQKVCKVKNFQVWVVS